MELVTGILSPIPFGLSSFNTRSRKLCDSLTSLVFRLHFLQSPIHVPEEPGHERRYHPKMSGLSRGCLVYLKRPQCVLRSSTDSFPSPSQQILGLPKAEFRLPGECSMRRSRSQYSQHRPCPPPVFHRHYRCRLYNRLTLLSFCPQLCRCCCSGATRSPAWLSPER